MKIVIAIDSFKGSASSLELGKMAKLGVLEAQPSAKVKVFEIADGGEGTVSALQHGLSGQMISVDTVDLMERPISADYLLAGKLAVIESASVVGIDKISPSPETFEAATSLGLAALIKDAAVRGAEEVYLTLGGTGTSDGGLGLLKGLGDERVPMLIGLADVTNPYAGPQGYAHFFGKQKGGTKQQREAQDQAAQAVVADVKARLGLDLQSISGTGAAGGLGGAIVMLGGHIEPGFAKVAELLGIEQEIATADLVLTGEGRMDAQTANGKVPWGMAQLAASYKVPTVALCGALADDLGEMDQVLAGAYSIQTRPINLEEAMKKERTLANMQALAKNIIKTRFTL